MIALPMLLRKQNSLRITNYWDRSKQFEAKNRVYITIVDGYLLLLRRNIFSY